MLRPLLRGLVMAALLAVCVGSQSAAAASSTTFSGQATVVSGTVLGQPVSIVDTGPLPAAGGAAHNCLLAYPNNPDCQLQTVPDQTAGALTLELLSARTVGQGNHSHASASTVSVNVDLGKLIAGGPTFSASLVTAEANAACQAGVATADGTSQVLDATLAGVPLVLTPGTPVTVGPVTIIFDQVDTTQSGNTAAANVKALEIIVPLANTDLTIGFAHADITCATSQGNQAGCSDKVTGGGWYDLTGRDHFALAASAGDQTWGHLLYDDKAAGLKFHGRPDFAALVGPGGGIAAPPYSSAPAVTVEQGAAVVSGTNVQPFTLGGASYPAGSARFIAVAVDNGEGSKSLGDVFGIVLVGSDGSTIYSSNATASAGVLTSLLGTKLGGGNVQYHGCH